MIDDFVFFATLLGCVTLGTYYKKIEDVNMKKNYGAGLGLLVTCILCGHYVYHTIIMVWGNIIIIKCCNKNYLHQLSLAYTWLYLVYLHCNLKAPHYLFWIYQTIALRLVGLAFEIHMAEKYKTVTPDHSIKRTNSKLTNRTNSTVAMSEQPQSDGLETSSSQQPDQKARKPSDETTIASATQIKYDSRMRRSDIKGGTSKSLIGVAIVEIDLLTTEPTAIDILAYSYFFIGLHRGPYYRWQTFEDHFRLPFGVLGDCRVITEQKMKKALICSLGYLLLRMKYAPEVYYDDAFYKTYDNDFRYLYCLPQLVMYFLHYQMVMMLCTSVCTETGFGVYPADCVPVPGHGPTTELNLLKLASKKDVALQQEYNFSMLKCFENEKILFGPKMRDTVRAWDMPTRYWFWAFIHKNLVRSNKEVKSACSFLAWLLWSGPSIQHLIITVTMWVYLNLEAEFTGLYNTNDSSLRVPWNIGFSIMRLLCLIYLTPCLIVEDSRIVLKYYNSIYWSYHIVLFLLTLLAIIVFKRRETRLAGPTVSASSLTPSTSKAHADGNYSKAYADSKPNADKDKDAYYSYGPVAC